MIVWFAIGVVLLVIGFAITIAWHELGHYVTARMFGIRVPQFMIGFGPTIFSRTYGETEVGVKALPFGGYIRMIGMIPPAPGEKVGRSRRSGPLQSMIDDIREQSNEEFVAGDEDRQFWTRAPWKRIIVMAAGPAMNLILAAIVFTIVLMGVGITDETLTVQEVSRCAVPAQIAKTQGDDACPPGKAPDTPAALAGIRPGDTIVSYDGVPYDRWDDLARAIRTSSGPTPFVVERAGQQVPLTVTPIRTTLPKLDGASGTETGSFIGFAPTVAHQRLDVHQTLEEMGATVRRTGEAVVRLPSRVPDLFGAVFLGEQRSLDSPVSVVGVSRLGGEVLASHGAPSDELATMLAILAEVNVSLCLLNLLPILPLDGGHILPALWEAAKKRLWRLRGRPEPGAVDLAKLLPVAYAFAILIMGYGALVIVADIINPIRLS